MFVLTPISWPIAKLQLGVALELEDCLRLDHVLGADHKGRYNFAELRAIVSLHAGLKMGSDEDDQVVFKSVDEHDTGIIYTLQPHPFNAESVVVFTETLEIPAKSTKLKASVLRVTSLPQVGQQYYATPCEPWSLNESLGPWLPLAMRLRRGQVPTWPSNSTALGIGIRRI